MLLKDINFSEILNCALTARSIFHSEGDFQHHLAWYLRVHLERVRVRLEYPISETTEESEQEKRKRRDIVLMDNDKKIGIELKYRTNKLECTVNEESFHIKQHGAQEDGRYYFFKDIKRLENWLKRREINVGFAVLLTNSRSYWKYDKKRDTKNKGFMLHEGRVAKGVCSWDSGAAASTKKHMPNSIELQGKYTMNWKDAPVQHVTGKKFRYLLVPVKPIGE